MTEGVAEEETTVDAEEVTEDAVAEAVGKEFVASQTMTEVKKGRLNPNQITRAVTNPLRALGPHLGTAPAGIAEGNTTLVGVQQPHLRTRERPEQLTGTVVQNVLLIWGTNNLVKPKKRPLEKEFN